MPTSRPDRSITGLFADMVLNFTALVRTEGELARAEIAEKISQIGAGLVLIVAGAVLLMPALVVLLEAAVAALNQTGLQPYWSSLAVGGGVLLVGFILAMIGISRLKPKRLIPNKTIHQLQEDAAAAKRQTRSTNNEYERAA